VDVSRLFEGRSLHWILEKSVLKQAFLSLIGVFVFSVSTFAASTLAPAIRKAPEVAFTVPGKGQELLSQYRGKVVALEFIFTTCPHCQAASHMMSRFQNELGSRGFQAIDVAFNDNSDLLVDAFAKEQQTTFPVGWTTREQVLAFLGISAVDRFVVPQVILIDREGMIHYQTPPLGDEESYKENVIRERIEALLAMPSGHRSAALHHTAAPKR